MMTEDLIVATVAEAARPREPLLVQGHGTKAGMLRPVQAARSVSTEGVSGITLYAPKELIISAWAGTPVAEGEAAGGGPQFDCRDAGLVVDGGGERQAADTRWGGGDEWVGASAGGLGGDARPR